MTKKEEGAPDAQEFSGAPPAPKVVTPLDIQQKEFRVSRFGGYKMRDVDEFLDEVTEAMSRVLEENQRLHARGGQPAPPAIGAPNLSEASRQADEILGRARVRAARIEQEARDRSASQATSGEPAPVSDADRAAVMAFLNREREFLQSLGSLMQQHAEVVKGMARSAKRLRPPTGSKPLPEGADTTEGTGGAPPPKSERAAERAKTTSEGSTVAAEPRRGPEAKPGTADAPRPGTSATSSARQRPAGPSAEQPMVRVQEAEQDEGEPVRLEEPAPAAVKADDEPAERPQEGSLRELFWGED
jgi:DivIVA domain-containing protein